MYLLLFKEPIAKKIRGKLILMGIEKPINKEHFSSELNE
jgi:hypothetical protein